MSLFNRIKSFFPKKKIEPEPIDVEENKRSKIESNIKPQSKKNEVLIFDQKKRIFVVKKRISEVALYFPDTKKVLIKHSNNSESEITFSSSISDKASPVSCRWNNDEIGSIALYDPNTTQFFIKKPNGDEKIITFNLNNEEEKLIPLTGHWGSDKKSSVGLYSIKNGLFYLKEATADNVSALTTFKYEEKHEKKHEKIIPLMGDWNGNGSDDIGFYDQKETVFYLHDAEHAGFKFGNAKINNPVTPLVGKWDDSGKDNIGTYNAENGVFMLRYEHDTVITVDHFRFGPINKMTTPLVGDWDGSGTDKIALYNNDSATVHLSLNLSNKENNCYFIFSKTTKNNIPFVHYSTL